VARISGVDLPRNKQVLYALPYIHGIGLTSAKQILQETGIAFDVKTDDLTESEVAALRNQSTPVTRSKARSGLRST